MKASTPAKHFLVFLAADPVSLLILVPNLFRPRIGTQQVDGRTAFCESGFYPNREVLPVNMQRKINNILRAAQNTYALQPTVSILKIGSRETLDAVNSLFLLGGRRHKGRTIPLPQSSFAYCKNTSI